MANELLDAKIDRLETHRPFGMAEVETMSREVSPSMNRAYGVVMVSRLWRIARATVYRHRHPAGEPRAPGPCGPMSDDELATAIRDLLAQGPSHGVLRLTSEHGLQAPGRVSRSRGSKAHDGTIRTERVDPMWGSDLTSTLTGEGQASILVAVDHCSAESVGIHAARRATRFEALEPIRQGVRACFGGFAEGLASAVVGVLEGVERLAQLLGAGEATQPEQVFLERPDKSLGAAVARTWIVERHGYRTPAEARADQLGRVQAA